MFTYENFKNELKRELQCVFGEAYEVLEERVVKNNGIAMDGLAVIGKGIMGNHAAPIIYVPELYENHKAGCSVEELVNQVEDSLKQTIPIDISILEKSFWEICHLVSMVLVNKELNQEKLKELVTMDFLDLSVIFKLKLHSFEGMSCTCNITKALLERWKITKETLTSIAWNNLLKEKVVLQDVMSFILKEDRKCFAPEDELDEDLKLMVLTNEELTYGASMLMRTEILDSYANKVGKNLYIFPSSINEIMLLADNGTRDAEELQEMVTFINEYHVDEKEVLSNSIYYYDRRIRKVRKLC